MTGSKRSTVYVVAGSLCAANVAFGLAVGYRDIATYLIFWALSALVAAAAWRIASCVFGADDLANLSIHASVVAFATIVLCTGVPAVFGRLTLGSVALAQLAWTGGAFLLRSYPVKRLAPQPVAVPVIAVAVLGALAAFGVGYGVTHAPLTLYDSVSYHLFFAARWLQDRTLSIIPTPFSDEAQAYAPANGELFFVWLMLPFHGDLLARIGQLPFALLGAVTVFALGRRLGAAPDHAAYPAAFFLLSRPVFEQALGANVDLVCAAMFLATAYLGILAVDRDRSRDWAMWGVSLGLYLGTKYLALVYTPLLLLIVLARGPRRRLLWGVPGVTAFALPWYLRNWIAAGSPIYPSSLSVAGVTLARGAFGRGAMLNTIFHTSNVRLFPAMAAHAFGPTLLIAWLPFAAIGFVKMLRTGWWPAGVIAITPYLMVPLYWFGVPVNVDSRFLMPAVGPALLPLAFPFTGSRRWNAALHALYAAAMIWIVVGVHRDIPATVPWFMAGWLSLDGLVGAPFLVPFAILAATIGATWWTTSTRPRLAISLAVAICAASAAILAAGGEYWCRPSRCDYVTTTSPHIRSNLVFGWRWVADNVRHATIAYTGINLPYPLTGDRLTNRVVYANIDGHPRWRFHDYDRAYRDGRFRPSPPLLASSSGELMPVSARLGPRDDAVRPRYERMAGSNGAWMGNLAVLGVTHVFIAALSAYEIDNVVHNARGFPVEDDWAAAEPAVFELVYENPQVRIYAVKRRATDRV